MAGVVCAWDATEGDAARELWAREDGTVNRLRTDGGNDASEAKEDDADNSRCQARDVASATVGGEVDGTSETRPSQDDDSSLTLACSGAAAGREQRDQPDARRGREQHRSAAEG